MLAVVRKLFRPSTRLPDELSAALDSEGVLFRADRVTVIRRFSGSVPGLHSGSSISRTAGALAFTDERVVATLAVQSNPTAHLVDSRWEDQAGPLKIEISSNGVTVDVDIARVDPHFRGHLALHYKAKLPAELLARLPRTTLASHLTADDVSRVLGVRRR